MNDERDEVLNIPQACSLRSQFFRCLAKISTVTSAFARIYNAVYERVLLFHVCVIRDTFNGERHYESRQLPYSISEFDGADVA